MSNGSWKRILRERFRKRIIELYGERCAVGVDCEGVIQAHHIDGNVQNGAPSNGTILCQKHHAEAHREVRA